MRVFSSGFREFQGKLIRNELFDELGQRYPQVVGRSAAPSEVNSRKVSHPRLEMILGLANLPDDVWISIEEQIPYYAKRIDAVLFGHEGQGRPNMVIVELKAWGEAKAVADGNVETFIGELGLWPSRSLSRVRAHPRRCVIPFGRSVKGE